MAKQKLTKWYYNNLKVNNWNLYVAVSEQGVTFIGSNNKGFNELESWLKKKGPNILLIVDQEGKTNLVMEQLTEYLMGKRTFFTLAFDFTGTLFQKRFEQKLLKYHMEQQLVMLILHKKLDIRKQCELWGTAIGNNAITILVPCHRVLGKNNALRGYRGGLEMKASLLQLENIW
ncbi:methylated-DNA--[protein]-cysteine S-methyltransferase [Spiroplasma endosymbiont of Seladonia tumulorum]|uniref:methylated-DNA--[protein]-cysteine S-methyltransferase n=1 Tax=Spiroplasma endosymbiont of Seladonia tumulorum TaxID=3066321 RepID=UPI0030CC26CA